MEEYTEELTAEEEDEAGRAMVRAALESFGEFPVSADESLQSEIARRVVRALVAVAGAEKAELRRLKNLKGKYVFLMTAPAEALATAFWMWSENVDIEVDEVAPASVSGEKYLGFAQGLAASIAMTQALDLLEDRDFMSVFATRGAEELLPKNLNMQQES